MALGKSVAPLCAAKSCRHYGAKAAGRTAKQRAVALRGMISGRVAFGQGW
jgi:hypothetical protein